MACPMNPNLLSCDLLGQLPYVAAERWGDRTCLIFKEKSWTYRQFENEVQALSGSLFATGIRSGDRVAVWLPNSPELLFLLFAIMRIGAIAVPLNTRYKSLDLTYALSRSRCVMVISAVRSGPVDLDAILGSALGESRVMPTGRHVYDLVPELKSVIMIGDSTIPGHVSWSGFREAGLASGKADAISSVRSADAALMLFTSGTTGRPKGVMLNHAGLRLCFDRARIMAFSSDDIQLTYLPLFHIYAFSYSVLMSFISGAPQILMEVFNPQLALQLIQKYRVTVIHGFDAHFSDLLAAQRRLALDVSSLRIASFATGSEAAKEIAQRVQVELCETASSYGLTEMWGGLTISPPGATLSQRCEASGLPQPDIQVRIIDPSSGVVLPNNTLGEIQVRSYARFIEYDEDPEATAAALDREGWFCTGDAGLLRDDGYLRCLARYKDMLKIGGENVSPAEIEGLLCAMAGVQAAAVVGQKDARLNEVPVAFLIAEDGHQLSEEKIIEYFRGRIANFKIPKRVIFVDELPMTPTGKVQKEVLRKLLAT